MKAGAQQVKAGQPVNFQVVVDDPDAKIDRSCNFVWDFGDGTTYTPPCAPSPACPTPYGPWSPPAKAPDHFQPEGVTHTYKTPGNYVASFTYQSHSFCNPDPYGGSGQGPAQVTVS